MFDFTDADNYQELIHYVQRSSASDRFGVLIGCNKSVGIYVKQKGLCALIDSHRASEKVGAVISISDSFTALIRWSPAEATTHINMD